MLFLLSASVGIRHDVLQSTLMHFAALWTFQSHATVFRIVGKRVSLLSSYVDLSQRPTQLHNYIKQYCTRFLLPNS